MTWRSVTTRMTGERPVDASRFSTAMASASVGARCAQPTRSRVAGRLRASQKCVASRGKIPNGLRRHQRDPMGFSPGGRLHDNPPEASNRLPGLASQRDALRRQFDDVRQVKAIGLSRLQFDQGDQPVAIAVCTIHAGYYLPVASGPERPLRVGECVIHQLPRYPLVRLGRVPANLARCSPHHSYTGRAADERKPELSR